MQLPVVQEPDANRSVLLMVGMGDAVLFHGRASDAPALNCGSCDKVLVSGILLRQFADGRRRLKATGLPAVAVPGGRFRLSSTIEITDIRLVTVGEQGPLIIRCGQCQAYNEIPSDEASYESVN